MNTPFDEGFNSTVRTLLRPTPPEPPPSGILRVADLFSAESGLASTIRDAGLEIVYTESGTGKLRNPKFDRMPPFDVLTATLPDGIEQWVAFDHVLRFLRVRRPLAFLLLGSGDVGAVENQTNRLGYRLTHGETFVAGMLQLPLRWPSEPKSAAQVLEWIAENVWY